MSPVEKALWYIEGHLRLDLSLADIAAGACVSRHHLLRAFGAATGLSVMRYVRGRRLSEAAQRSVGRSRRHPHCGRRRRLQLARGVHPRVRRPVRRHACGSSSARQHRAARTGAAHLAGRGAAGNRESAIRGSRRAPGRRAQPPLPRSRGLRRRAGSVAAVRRRAGADQGPDRPARLRRLLSTSTTKAAWITCAACPSPPSARRVRSSRVCAFRGGATQSSSIASTSPVFAGPGMRSGTAGCRAPATRSRMLRCSSDTTITFIPQSGRGGFSLLVPLS